jgi:dipeptidyl aminopeptidase/acylaminoacyl peptidase
MNRQTVRYVDVLVDIIIEHFGMKEPKIVSTGGSMGGQCALIYTAYAKVTPTAAALNCPVCDMPYHYTERPDLPRTMHSAFGGGEDSLSETIEAASPLHLAQKAGLPKIKYLVIHCEADTAVNKERHSDRLTAEMRNHGYDVTYITLPGKNHCDLTPEAYAKYYGFAEEALNG